MGQEDNRFSRRQIVSTLGAGLATTVVRPVFAASDSLTPSSSTESLQDPTTKYPKPPFNPQSQPWPGLASKMDPRPDTAKPVTAARALARAERHSSQVATPEWAVPRR